MMKTPPPDPALQKAVAWFVIVVGLVLGYFSFSRSYNQLTSASWPKATAHVLKSDMYQHTGRSRDWCMRMTYEYNVDGKTYRSRNIGVSIMGNAGCDRSKDVIAARLARLAPGMSLRISHHPQDHGFAAAYLTGLDAVDYIFGSIAIVLVVSGIYELRRSRLSPV